MKMLETEKLACWWPSFRLSLGTLSTRSYAITCVEVYIYLLFPYALRHITNLPQIFTALGYCTSSPTVQGTQINCNIQGFLPRYCHLYETHLVNINQNWNFIPILTWPQLSSEGVFQKQTVTVKERVIRHQNYLSKKWHMVELQT